MFALEKGGDASAAAAEEEQTRGAVEVFAILDPLSETAQRAAGVLVWLRETLGAEHIDITIVLNPSIATSELPLSRFYRFVGGGAAAAAPAAHFRNMPRQHILTMKVETPEAWIVQAERAEHDLDNIRLGDEQLMGGAAWLHSRCVCVAVAALTHTRPARAACSCRLLARPARAACSPCALCRLLFVAASRPVQRKLPFFPLHFVRILLTVCMCSPKHI